MTYNDAPSARYLPGESVGEGLGAPTYRPSGGFPPYDPSHQESSPASADQVSTAEIAKDQAASVASGAADAAQNVAGVAKEQVGQVAAEASRQLKELLGQAQTELSDQAAQQQKRVASGLRDLGGQFQAMAQGAAAEGVAVDLAREAAERTNKIAGWLEVREPGSVLAEVRSFARQRPGVFLALAVGAGMVAGRLARGLSADPRTSAGSTRSPASPVLAPEMAAPSIGDRKEPAALAPPMPSTFSAGGPLVTRSAETVTAPSWSDAPSNVAQGHR